MDKAIIDIAQKYGPAGLIVLALGAFVLFLMKQHRDERSEWRKTIEEQHKEALDVTKSAISQGQTVVTMVNEMNNLIRARTR